ncbi:BTB/POZ domain-containing protein KCTD9-like protein, partial [Aphelenchoides avenae]
DTSGAFFIDRDPRYFRNVLNYLRSDSIDMEGNVSLETLLAEADFYCLSGLKKRLEDMRSAATAKTQVDLKTLVDEAPRAKTVAVDYYKTKCNEKTQFTSSDIRLLRQIESYCNTQLWYSTGDALVVYKTFSLTELCDILGKSGLVLRHIEKNDEELDHEVLHFSSF